MTAGSEAAIGLFISVLLLLVAATLAVPGVQETDDSVVVTGTAASIEC